MYFFISQVDFIACLFRLLKEFQPFQPIPLPWPVDYVDPGLCQVLSLFAFGSPWLMVGLEHAHTCVNSHYFHLEPCNTVLSRSFPLPSFLSLVGFFVLLYTCRQHTFKTTSSLSGTADSSLDCLFFGPMRLAFWFSTYVPHA